MVKDESQIAAVVAAIYEMISGPAGPRDWSQQLTYFHPACRQMRTGLDGDGLSTITIMDPKAYRENTAPIFASEPFYEIEIGRRIDIFGNMAQVWSLYEAKRSPDDPIAERRGVNSMQLYKGPDGNWRIVSMIWDNERPGLALPAI
jgi:hypothetical protein